MWQRFLEWVGYTASYREIKAELRGATSNLSPSETLAMRPVMCGPTYRFPIEAKLAKWRG